MAIEKKISEVELLEQISSNTNVVCEQDGSWKRLNIFNTDFYKHALNSSGIEVKGDGETPALVKIITDTAGHVIGCENVTKNDILKLGIEEGGNNYTHPEYNNQSSGLYKIEVEDGHIKTVSAVTKEDITNLGIPAQDTTYRVGGEELGLVKNGGNVTINKDGTMTAPSSEGAISYESEGEYSFATNDSAIATGDGAFASGTNTQAIGDNSFAHGNNSIAGANGYYIKSIDFENNKIYLSKTKVSPSTTHEIDTTFETPAYEVNDKFSIISGSHYILCATISAIVNNEVTYEGDLGFTEFTDDGGLDGNTFVVPKKPNIGIDLSVALPYNTAIGTNCTAIGIGAVSIGRDNLAAGNYSYVEGRNNIGGYGTHVDGRDNIALGHYSHAEGYGNKASGEKSHVEGADSRAKGNISHAEGCNTIASGEGSHTEGFMTAANGNYSHAEGRSTANGHYSHAEGRSTANGHYSHAEGQNSLAEGFGSHAEGRSTANGNYSHAEGHNSLAEGFGSHAEGQNSLAKGSGSHAEGGVEGAAYQTIARGSYSHAEGAGSLAEANGSHAEGVRTKAIGEYSHAEGLESEANASGAHAENCFCIADGYSSHAEGYYTNAKHDFSHAEGSYTVTTRNAQHVEGKHNIEDTDNKYIHIVGNGTSSAKNNAHTIEASTGNAWYQGSIESTGSDYAEYFEWKDGNPNNEDRIGLIVTLDGEKIKCATIGDDILGIISGTVAVLGDNYECSWKGKYLTDDFGRVQYEDIEEFIDIPTGELDKEGNIITETKSLGLFKHPILNPDYNPEQVYINRADRPEWSAVGMLGKLFVKDDGTCQINGYVTVGENGVATASEEKTNMRVLSRVNDNVIRVLLK